VIIVATGIPGRYRILDSDHNDHYDNADDYSRD